MSTHYTGEVDGQLLRHGKGEYRYPNPVFRQVTHTSALRVSTVEAGKCGTSKYNCSGANHLNMSSCLFSPTVDITIIFKLDLTDRGRLDASADRGCLP